MRIVNPWVRTATAPDQDSVPRVLVHVQAILGEEGQHRSTAGQRHRRGGLGADAVRNREADAVIGQSVLAVTA